MRWSSLRTGLITLLLCITGPFTTLRGQTTPSVAHAKGRLVIEGGPTTPRHAAIYQAILDGRDGDGPLCIIPTNNSTPDSTTAAYIEKFSAHGWGKAIVGIRITTAHPEAASDPAIVARLKQCSGFFFVGGRQSRSSRVFRPGGLGTPALDAILARYRQGAVVAGTSAGAAIMSDPMINGGRDGPAMTRGVGPGGVTMAPGLGFFPGVLVDQHFFAQNRIGRLLVAVLQLDEYKVAFGIDVNTALVVEGDSAWVVGASGVLFVDGREAQRAAEGNGGSDLRVQLMGAGDAIDLKTFRVQVSPEKTPLMVNSGALEPPDNIFKEWAFLHLLYDLGRSSATTVVPAAEGYDFVIHKEPGFVAVSAGTPGVQGTPAGLSMGPLRIDIRRHATTGH